MMEQIVASSAASAALSESAIQGSVHHVQLSDPSWALWQQSVLRGAGFAIDYPLRLAAPVCAAAADHLSQSEQAAGEIKQTVSVFLKQARGGDPSLRATCTKALHQLHIGKLPKSEGLPTDVQAAIAPLAQARSIVETARTAYQAQFAQAIDDTTKTLGFIVNSEHFRQALIWQNRQALHTCLEPFLQKLDAQHDSRFRQHRTLLVKYLQRYAMKNDTIGFFGPVGWARWQPESPSTTLQIGPNLLAQRNVYIEGWCINALSQLLTATHPTLLHWAKPRLMPAVHIEQTMLHLPFVKPLPLSVTEERVLSICTGKHTAQVIAHFLLQQGVPGLNQATDVYAILEKMLKLRRITWSFDVSLEDPFPALALRRNLEQINEPTSRALALAMLESLENAANAVPQATSSAQLDEAIGNFEAVFTQLTAREATRSSGQMYAGRTLLYEDCLRDVKLTLGANILQTLEQPLALLLTSARWLGYHLAEAGKAFFLTAYQELAQKNAASVIPFAEYFLWVNGQFDDELRPMIEQIQIQFQKKWEALLNLAEDAHRINVVSAAVAESLVTTFEIPDHGTLSVRYHSPDIMLDAANLDAINRNDFQGIMGEMHVGMNTLNCVLFRQQNPHAAEFYEAISQDMPTPQLIILASSQEVPATRLQQAFALPKDYRLVTTADICDAPVEHILRTGDLVVESIAGEVRIRTRDQQHHFDVLAVFAEAFSILISDTFTVLPKRLHTPRVTIDRLVVMREAWHVPADAMPFVDVQDPAECYASVRRWVQAQEMPRFLFYRTPKEMKPCFLDLDSPLSVELFVREVRHLLQNNTTNQITVSLSEMLPTPDHAWLVDNQGTHYTSELRIAVLDKQAVAIG